MIQRILNLFKLMRILKERGNWRLIRHSRKQLWDFILCHNGLNKRPIASVIPYWFFMLKGVDVLVWRLETFGFLFPPGTDEETRRRLNHHIA